MKTITIGGVPEHFNLPWQLAIEEFNQGQEVYQLIWKDFPGGTGDMCFALRNKEVDAAIVLTEGILKDIDSGNQAQILMVYVSSPLVWGIHVAGTSYLENGRQLSGKKAAISRYGSGSHLMTSVLADTQGIPASQVQFEVVGNLEGARQALALGSADYFMWEKYTTKPLVDSGEFKRIGECPTPWPCFLLAANSSFSSWPGLPGFLKILREKVEWVTHDEQAIETIANRYNLQVGDVREWRSQTQWMGLEWSSALREDIVQKMSYYGL